MKLLFGVLFIYIAALGADKPWDIRLDDALPLLGHRNWIVIADSAYPLQSREGIETIIADTDQVRVLKHVLAALDKTKHVRPIVYVDKEIRFLNNDSVTGIGPYKATLEDLTRNRESHSLPHEEIIHRLDEAGQTFRILIIKTNMTMPYTSVFLQLDCAYWSPAQEQKLRAAMAGERMKYLIGVALAMVASAQTRPNLEQSFPNEQMMTIGVYYYPEAWPESQLERDITNIKKFGFEYIHMAEFAWAFMEPEEGRFEFGWLDKAVDLATKNGLKVVLCTPSATPPAWLARKHPEILMVRSDGTTMQHGSREQADWSSPVYRSYVEKIDAAMAQHYGGNPTMWGWQLDNELSHYGAGISYAPPSQKKFRDYLREKYGTIAKLNTDWGNSFWSQMYDSFDQIEMPDQHDLVAGVNPHSMLDVNKWFASEAADYLRFQTAVLRRYVKNQWITTNFMMNYERINPANSEKDLDIMSFTMYPVSGGLFQGQLGFRMGDAAQISFTHDFLRNLGSGIEGPMELQPGQVNWAPVNPQPQPGVVHAWIMRAFGLGSRLVCVYRYRQPLAGDELYHKTMVEPDGVTLAPGGKEFVQAIDEMKKLRALYKPDAKAPADYSSRRTAFLYSYENRWDMDNHKQTTRWDTTGHWMKYYRALKEIIAPVDVLTEDRDFSKYPYLIAPSYQLIDKDLIVRLTKYAEDGGTLIMTCRSGQKDRRGHIWESLWAEPIYDLIGAAIPKYDVLPMGRDGKLTAAGKTYSWGSWGDILEPRPGTEVLATYADQFYKGSTAATEHKLGKGRVVYVGVDTLTGELESDLLWKIYGKPTRLPMNLMVDWRDGFWVAANFTDTEQTVPSKGAKMLVGSSVIPPGGVAIWQ